MRLGEIEYDRTRTRDAKSWIRMNPAAFAWLSLARMRDFWFPQRGDHPFESIVIWISTLLSIPGMVLMARQRAKVSLFVVIVLMIYPLMYYIVVSDLRYRVPVLWMSFLPAGYFLFVLKDRIKQR